MNNNDTYAAINPEEEKEYIKTPLTLEEIEEVNIEIRF